MSVSSCPRILFISSVPIQAQLTGPAIRCLELARQVSLVAEVTIAAFRSVDRVTPDLAQGSFVTEADLIDLVQAHDVVVAQGSITLNYPKLLLSDRIKVFDLYDPLNLEMLEHGRQVAMEQRLREYRQVQSALHGQLAVGDFFLCANERQRDYYLGMLAAAGRINPVSYDVADRDMRHLLVVVPMGISAQRPQPTRSAVRGVHPAVRPDDIMLIWGGSLLDWLDPLTLIRAMAQVQATRADVKLFFLASRNPLLLDTHSIAARAIDLSRELGLLDQTVIFNDDWVAYDDRVNYLLEADIGVTTHLDHLETRFSFRTRVLDYLWAGLPMISSEGDMFSELIQREQLGLTAPPGEVDALAQAILKLANDVELRRSCAANVQRAAESFQWEQVAQPLVEFCRAPRPAIDHAVAREGAVQTGRLMADPADPITAQIKADVRRVRRSYRAQFSAQIRHTIKQILKQRYTTVLYERPIEAEGMLLPGQRRGQSFQAYAPNLNGLEVLIGTFGRVNTCEVMLHLCDSPQAVTDVVTVCVDAMPFQDCKFYKFTFPPIADSAGREFYVWLESPDAVVSDGVTLFRYIENGELVLTQHYA